MRPSGNSPWHFKSFFRQPGLAQNIEENGRRWRRVHKKFDRELRIETTGLCQSRFRLRVAPARGLSSGQISVGNVRSEPRIDSTLVFLDGGFKPTPANLSTA